MTQYDVVGLGASVIDVLQLVDHYPAPEEVQFANDMSIQGGGPVATALVTLTRLGARTAMVDAIADDWRGRLILEEYQSEGVSTDHIQPRHGYASPLACVVVTEGDGSRTIVASRGTVPELTLAEVPRVVIQSAKILHVNGRHWEACRQACAWAREAGVQVSMDGGASLFRPELRQLVPMTDICIVARDFAEQYAGETDVDKAANVLLNEGPYLVVITDGTNGSWVYSRNAQGFHQPAYLLPDVVDTTGCGDGYHGAFLYGLLKGMDLHETAAIASAVAALNTQHLGGRVGLPTMERVRSFLSTI